MITRTIFTQTFFLLHSQPVSLWMTVKYCPAVVYKIVDFIQNILLKALNPQFPLKKAVKASTWN